MSLLNRQQIISIFFFVLLIFVLYQLGLIFSPFFSAMFWAAILTFAFLPLHNLIKRLTRGKETLSALITTLIVLCVTLPLAGLVVSTVAVQGIKMYDWVSTTVTVDKVREIIESIKTYHWFNLTESRFFNIDQFQENITTYMLNVSKFIGNYATNFLAQTTKNILIIGVNTILVIFFVFYFFLNGERLANSIKKFIPMEDKNKDGLFLKLNETLSAVVRGQVFTAVIQGSFGCLIYWLLGLPIPVFLGFLTFLSSMIPVTGAAAIWVPFVIYYFFIGAYTKAVILLVLGTLFISLLDNFLKPYLIGEKTKLPILLLFLGILGGLRLYGLTGIFLGPVLLALFFALIKIYQEEYLSIPK